jgi:hypothetical protein
MAEKSYAHRDVVDKLGIKPGMRVRILGSVPSELADRVRKIEDVEIVKDEGEEPAHVVLFALLELSDAKPALARLRKGIVPEGAIWVLTRKKGQPNHIRQESLIPLGKAVGLVDNKVAGVDEETSAIRFVIPLAQREKPKPPLG